MDSISHVKRIHLSVHITYNIDQVLKMFVFTGLVTIIDKHCTYIHIYVQSEAQIDVAMYGCTFCHSLSVITA